MGKLYVSMELVEGEIQQANTVMARIRISYACASCQELLRSVDLSDGLIEIEAKCPKCGAINQADC